MIRLTGTITGVGFTFDPSDPKFRETISIQVNDKPWKSVLQEALAHHGLVMIKHATASNSYTIVSSESPAMAVRINEATKAAAAIDAIVLQLETGNIEMAKKLLNDYRSYNDGILEAAPM